MAGTGLSLSGSNKLKILYLMKILLENTDESHYMTMEQIIDALKLYDIEAERKSIYADIKTLQDYGIDILLEKRERNAYYHVVSRQFELAELKLLVDSVQSARFITEKKSNELIKKLEGLASKFDASQLQQQVFVTERVKSGNEKILYNIDAIHKAIETNRVIRFRYFKRDTKKRAQLRHNGAEYEVSPWAMTLVEENYYLVAYDAPADCLKYYRLDKMKDITVTESPRAGRNRYTAFDVAGYAKKRFRMYDGEEVTVRLRCKNEFADVIFDRFGTNLMLHDEGDGSFEVNVEVALSRHFYAWVMAMNDFVVIAGPDKVLKDARNFVKELGKTYGTNKDQR